MSKATEILKENYTAYPNALMRNYNNLLTKNERHLMIFLWDRLYGYKFPKSELSYSLILKDCKDFPKNNKKLSEAIKGLERKGLLKVFRNYNGNNTKTNKYYIGEKQVLTLEWYGRNFKGWKDGIIELPKELTENEIENEKEQQEKTLFEEITEIELGRDNYVIKNNRKNKNEEIVMTDNELTKPLSEKKYIKELTENEFIEIFPDINLNYHYLWKCYTIDDLKSHLEKKKIEQSEKAKQVVAEKIIEEELVKKLLSIF